MSELIKQSDWEAMRAKAKRYSSMMELVNHEGPGFIKSYIVVPDEEYEQVVQQFEEDALPWEEAMALLRSMEVQKCS